jgi:hypothetical protein
VWNADVLVTPCLQQKCLTFLKGEGVADDELHGRLLQAQCGVIEDLGARIEELETELPEARRCDQLAQERAGLFRALPNEADVNKLIHYETMINRQLEHALHELERLQRARHGDNVPAPVALDVSVTGVKDPG